LLFASVGLADTRELLSKANELREKKDYVAAVKAFSRVIEVDPTSADGYYGRGASYAAMGDYDSAINDLSEANGT
jgi:tetratricopeptide (TPR) repeat protein